MTKEDFDRLFERFLSGSLSASDAEELRRGLEEEKWQRRWRELSDMEGMLAGEFGVQAAQGAAPGEKIETGKSSRGLRSIRSGRSARERSTANVVPWPALAAVAALLVLAIGLLQYFRPGEAVVVAVLEGVSGEVSVLRGGGRERAQNGLRLSERDGLQTEKGGRGTIKFADGTLITLAGESESRAWLHAPQAIQGAHGKQMTLEVGRLEASVAPQPASLPLVIRTPNSEVKILGTQFTLETSPFLSRLEVREGRVQMQRSMDGKTVEVSGGHFAVSSRDDELVAAPITPVAAAAPAAAAPAAAAPAAAAPAAAAPVAAVARALFNGKDLSGWTITHGVWNVENGVVSGHGLPGKFSRIESTTSFAIGELVCKLRVTGARVAEVQFSGYRNFFPLVWENYGAWQELKVRVRATEIRGTLDGKVLEMEQGGPADGKPSGVLSFYTTVNATLEIKDAFWTEGH